MVTLDDLVELAADEPDEIGRSSSSKYEMASTRSSGLEISVSSPSSSRYAILKLGTSSEKQRAIFSLNCSKYTASALAKVTLLVREDPNETLTTREGEAAPVIALNNAAKSNRDGNGTPTDALIDSGNGRRAPWSQERLKGVQKRNGATRCGEEVKPAGGEDRLSSAPAARRGLSGAAHRFVSENGAGSIPDREFPFCFAERSDGHSGLSFALLLLHSFFPSLPRAPTAKYE